MSDDTRPDVAIENHGGIWMFRPETAAGRDWLQANAAAESWQWRAGGLAVEARYAAALVVALRREYSDINWATAGARDQVELGGRAGYLIGFELGRRLAGAQPG